MALPIVKLDAEPKSSFISEALHLILRGYFGFFIVLFIFSNYNATLNLEANFHIQRDSVIEKWECLYLFVFLNILYILEAMPPFRSIHTPLRPWKDHPDREKANYSTAAQLRGLLKGSYNGGKYDVRKQFAEYLADPTRFLPSYSRFSRREQMCGVLETVVVNLFVARLPFREWSKINDRVPAIWDLPWQLMGFCVDFWFVAVMIGDGRRLGLSLKLGQIAREIRKECLQVHCAELGIEQACVEKEAKERLRWWVAEVLRDVDDAGFLEAGIELTEEKVPA